MKTRSSLNRGMMVAVVLGTALSALGASAYDLSSDLLQDLNRYCTACWRNARVPVDHWTDCTQEVFVRLLERVPISEWEKLMAAEGEERRELVRAIDTVKKRSYRTKRYADLSADIADNRVDPDRQLEERRELLAYTASQILSARQQRIIQRLAEGWSIPEIARVEDTSAERISDEKYKAVCKLREHLGIERA